MKHEYRIAVMKEDFAIEGQRHWNKTWTDIKEATKAAKKEFAKLSDQHHVLVINEDEEVIFLACKDGEFKGRKAEHKANELEGC